MGALHEGDVDAEGYLRTLLSEGTPNAVHRTLAALALDGAYVWTVNFDRHIENAGPALRVSAWPGAPSPGDQLFKPHGSIDTEMIFTADDVLRPLRADWAERLAEHASGRIAIVLGYAANDLDLVPVWDHVLSMARQVVWFAMPDIGGRRHVESLLVNTGVRGLLSYRVAGGSLPNASRDFVEWCVTEGLVQMNPLTIAELDAHTEVRWPPLAGPRHLAAGEFLEAINDIQGARDAYLTRLRHGPGRLRAGRSLMRLQLNHGGSGTARALAPAALVPPVGKLKVLRDGLLRKRVTILANLGRHRAVLRATRRLGTGDVSTLFTLRTASLRVAGSLDDAISTGYVAVDRADRERHAVRRAHAAFQLGMALMWAGRIEEAQGCVAQLLEPIAALAASRWVAWLDFLTGCLHVHTGQGLEAVSALERAERRFTAEGLGDGVVSCGTAMLTAYRLRGDDDGFLTTRRRLAKSDTSFGVHYTRGHVLARVAVSLEDAEFAAWHRRDEAAAIDGFMAAAASPFRIHAAMGQLGLANLGRDVSDHAEKALAIASAIGAASLVREAEELLAGGALRETFRP